MRRVLFACLSSAALSIGTLAFVVGGAGVVSAAPRSAAVISLSGLWEVQIPAQCGSSCETIKFDTTNKTFAEHDKHGFHDHGTYSLAHQVLSLHWTAGGEKGVTFTGSFKSAADEFVGTYTIPPGTAKKGDLIALK